MRGNPPMLVPFIIMKKSSHLFYFTRQKEVKQRREKKRWGMGRLQGEGTIFPNPPVSFLLVTHWIYSVLP